MELPANGPAGRQGCRAEEAEEVTLSVYDVSTDGRVRLLNGLLRPLGGGAFHAGVVVRGREWSFGGLQEDGTGVFDCKPRANPYHQFREAVALGSSRLSRAEIAELIALLKAQWPGSSYDLTANIAATSARRWPSCWA
ncbi:unnamed protein product [Prorocentrum cordatum]|uniref:PPPDE domain-containing protein n=1 Tax=Prorocentrum cordatum TaxID=2364126 RepID=A0ABN9SIX1_9DINO|nr:unnamed protein product [Polarella glacialis]